MSGNSEQVAKQCQAVAYMARAIARVYSDKAEMFRQNPDWMSCIEDIVGIQSAYAMEVLGDILNGIDAVTEEDAWMDPIFAEAQRLYPHSASCESDAGQVYYRFNKK